MIEKINILQQAIDHLSLNNYKLILEEIQKNYQEKQIVIPIIGQFSSGKSSLLNNLTGRDLLPEAKVETTALLTYIKSGANEQAFVECDNKRRFPISFDTVKIVKQSSFADNSELCKLLSIPETETVKAIHLTIADSKLPENITFVDTPGLNTVIEFHEELTREILPKSQLIFYVFAKTPTAFDLEQINIIKNLGLTPIFIRTFIDTFKIHEEDAALSLEIEKKCIQELMNVTEVKFYAISNELKEEKWNTIFEKFLKSLNNDVYSGIEKLIESSVIKRLQSISAEILKALNERKYILEQSDKIDKNEINSRIKQLEKDIELLNSRKKTLDSKTKNDFSAEISEIINDINNLYEKSQNTFINELNKQNTSEEIENFAYLYPSQIINRFVTSSKKLAEDRVNEFITDHCKQYDDLLVNLNDNLKMDSIDFSIKLKPLDMQSLDTTTDIIARRIEMLEEDMVRMESESFEHEKNIIDLNSRKEEIEDQFAVLQSQIESHTEEIQLHNNSYETKYKEVKGDDTVSRIFSGIGAVVDIAMLALPGDAILAGFKTTKTVTDVVKTTADTLKVVDTARDVLYGVKKTVDVIKKGNEKSGNFLDFVTAEFWFKKIGEKFDKPGYLEVDREYERLFNERKIILEQQGKQLNSEQLKKLESAGLIKNEIERSNKIIEINRKREEDIRKKLESEKAAMKKESEASVILKYKQSIKENFFSKYSEYYTKIISEIQVWLNAYSSRIVIGIGTELNQEINNVHTIMSNLSKELDSGHHQDELVFINNLIQEFNNI